MSAPAQAALALDGTTIWLAGTFRPEVKSFLAVGLDLPRGLVLQLVREPDNPYDANAIAVKVTLATLADAAGRVPDIDGPGPWHLGYLPGAKGEFDWAGALAPRIDAGEAALAVFDRVGSKRHNISIALSGPAVDAVNVGRPA